MSGCSYIYTVFVLQFIVRTCMYRYSLYRAYLSRLMVKLVRYGEYVQEEESLFCGFCDFIGH